MITHIIHYHSKQHAIEERRELIAQYPHWYITDLYLDNGAWALKCIKGTAA